VQPLATVQAAIEAIMALEAELDQQQ